MFDTDFEKHSERELASKYKQEVIALKMILEALAETVRHKQGKVCPSSTDANNTCNCGKADLQKFLYDAIEDPNMVLDRARLQGPLEGSKR